MRIPFGENGVRVDSLRNVSRASIPVSYAITDSLGGSIPIGDGGGIVEIYSAGEFGFTEDNNSRVNLIVVDYMYRGGGTPTL